MKEKIIYKPESGKIKKKRRLKPLREFFGSRELTNPFDTKSVYKPRLKSTRECEISSLADSVDNIDYFSSLKATKLGLVDIGKLVDLFKEARVYKRAVRAAWLYSFCDIPEFPSIELMDMTLPCVYDEFPEDANTSKSTQKFIKYFLAAPELEKIWWPMEFFGADYYDLQIHFKHTENSKTRKSLYIPLIKGNSLIPEASMDNFWHIFYVTNYKEKKRSVFNFHKTMQDASTAMCTANRKKINAPKLCDENTHFIHELEYAIKVWGENK